MLSFVFHFQTSATLYWMHLWAVNTVLLLKCNFYSNYVPHLFRTIQDLILSSVIMYHFVKLFKMSKEGRKEEGDLS